MSVSLDASSLAQQIKDVTLDAVNTVKEAVVGPEETKAVNENHRVFVGNLNFETTEDDLKALFSQVGEIVTVTLPTRKNFRTKSAEPSGIAFIGYTNDADAEKAVQTLSGKTLGEREINVAIARPVPERKPKGKSASKGVVKAQGAQKETGAVAGDNSAPEGVDGEKKKRKPRAKKVNGDSAETADDSTPKTNGAVTEARTPRAPREKGPPSDGLPSTTTLFVAGLNHKTTDAELKEVFSEYNPTSAHVALRPIPRYMVKKLAEKGEQRLGRGFGFVTFADQASQQSALQMDGHKLSEERTLAVKVAIETAKPEQAAEQDGAAEAVAA